MAGISVMHPQFDTPSMRPKFNTTDEVAPQLNTHVMSRLGTLGLDIDDSFIGRIERSKIGTCALLCFPSASDPQLRMIAESLLWLTIFDDLHDDIYQRTAPTLPAKLPLAIPALLSALDDGPCTGDSFSEFLEYLAARWRCWMTPQQFWRLVSAFYAAILAMAWEQQPGTPKLDDYIVVRRHLSFANICIEFVEPVSGIELPRDARDTHSFRALVTAASNVIAWSNDLGSYNYEMNSAGAGTPLTLPVLLGLDGECTHEKALEKASRILAAEMHSYGDAAREFSKYGTQEQRYTETLSRLVTGMCTIFEESPRYD